MIVEDPPIVRLAPQRYFRPKNRIAYIEDAENAGRSVGADHTTTQVPANDYLADRLGIGVGDLVSQTRYVIRMNERVVTASYAWEPWSLIAGTAIADPHSGPFANQGIVARFDAIGLEPTEVEEVLHIRFPEGDETTLFQISTLTQLVEMQQTFFSGETIIEAADIVFPATRHEFHFRMEIK